MSITKADKLYKNHIKRKRENTTMRIIILVILLFTYNLAHADSFDNNLKELFKLTEIKNDYSDLNTIIINQMQSGFFRAAQQNIDGSNFTEEQNKQVGEIMRSRFTDMVENYRAHIEKVMPYEKVETEVFVPLYKETYTEEEVKELIKFYNTPVGKKSVEVSKKLSRQVSERAAEKYDSLIVGFIEAQIKENIELVKKDISAKNIQ